MIKADTFLYLSRADIEALALSFRKINSAIELLAFTVAPPA